ncbi:MAG: hypothetical protein CMI79_01660 [Candidatus Pelagibacter sp.]|nr:hypothetical protein [Candidatus Pelagibacter sp.]
MINTTLQDVALFTNPKHVVGNNSAGPIQTSIFPNFGAVPELFSNKKVFLTDNMYNGTASNIKAAQAKYSGNGGRRGKRRHSKSKRPNAGMHVHTKKNTHKKGSYKGGKRLQTIGPIDQTDDAITANGGTVGAGQPQVSTYNHSGGSYKKTKRKTKSKKHRRSRKGGMGCKGNGSHKHKKSMHRSRKGGMGCKGNGSHKHKKKGGSGKQLEIAQGFGINGKNDTMFGALSSPIPIKGYKSCGVISPRN